jgi:HEPN domain-containing protein
MKETTQQWLNFAETDLLACEKLISDDQLTTVVTFHAQQVVEKCFKAIIEEESLPFNKIHSVSRLYGLIQNKITFPVDGILLQKIDAVYTTSRYPGDFGLMPDGTATKRFAGELFEFAKSIFENTLKQLINSPK